MAANVKFPTSHLGKFEFFSQSTGYNSKNTLNLSLLTSYLEYHEAFGVEVTCCRNFFSIIFEQSQL